MLGFFKVGLFSWVISFVPEETLSGGVGEDEFIYFMLPLTANFVKQSCKMKPCSAGTQSSISEAVGRRQGVMLLRSSSVLAYISSIMFVPMY